MVTRTNRLTRLRLLRGKGERRDPVGESRRSLVADPR